MAGLGVEISREEQRFLEALRVTDILHEFSRHRTCPPMMEFAAWDTEYHPLMWKPDNPRRRMYHQGGQWVPNPDRTCYNPGTESLGGHQFLSLLVRAGLVTNWRINQIFTDPRPTLDVSKAHLVPDWRKWSDSKYLKPEFAGLAKLAKILGKSGVQCYGWDGGYGDISESWRTVFVNASGEITRQGELCYGFI